MMDQSQPALCAVCRHRDPASRGHWACAAYPGGIPSALLDGLHDHRHAYPGDGGIRFEPEPGAMPDPPMTPDPAGVAHRRVQITNNLGLHLRAASRFVRLARGYRAEVRVRLGAMGADGKSILDLACLAAACGVSLDIEAAGPDAEAAVVTLADLVASGFHQDDTAT
jgi:phosphocarrier protein HPr